MKIKLVDKLEFLTHYYFVWGSREVVKRITKKKKRYKKYAGYVVKVKEKGNQEILNYISMKENYFIGRLGSSELACIREILKNSITNVGVDLNRLYPCYYNSGFYIADKENKHEYKKFTIQMLKAIKSIDVMAVWYNVMEDWVCKKYMPQCSSLIDREVLDFWNHEIPYTYALKGKKVLVISPFAKTIKIQYENNRTKLFSNKRTLPEFQLYVLESIQTIAGNKDKRFENFWEGLDYLFKESMKIDFDVALISCGAYGFLLGALLKNQGKNAVHMGGVLQVLFGIRGERWDDIDILKKEYNEYWVRPDLKEKPLNYQNIEGGCYW